jgi:hypothetical protein
LTIILMNNGSAYLNNFNCNHMKNNIYKNLVLVIGICFAIISCGDEQIYFPNASPPPEGANVKFVHAASDAAGVNFFINNAKISAGSAVGSGIAYAGAFPGTNYSILASGSSTLRVVVPSTPTVPESLLLTSDLSTETNKYYTVAFAGVAPNYEAVAINDDLSGITFDSKSYVRFVNLIHNSTNKLNVVATISTGSPAVITSTVIAQNVSYKDASVFIPLEPGDYTITLKDAKTDAVVATAGATAKLLAGNRIYTLFARGQIGQTGTKIPTLDRITNL